VNTSNVSRREFLEIGAVAAGASLVGSGELLRAQGAQSTRPTPPSDRVRFGIIGVGMQGQGLLSNSIAFEGVECVQACDLYDGRHTLAREIVRADLPVTRRYQALLENRDIDCLIVAVPDHWHKQILIDAVSAGKDVYCEKPMSHTAAQGAEMADAAKKSGRIVQVGSQRVSSQILAKAKEMIAQGMLGDLMLVEGSLGRNEPTGAWQYPPPPDLSPRNLDWDTWLGPAPKRPFDPVIFARWRCWKEYGTGVAGDLLVHLMSGTLFVLGLNEPPTQAMAVGDIRRWKDGRNMPDVHAVNFSYRGLPVSMRLNLGTAIQELYRIHGSKGLMEITSTSITFTPQLGIDTNPSYYASSFPRELREAYFKKWQEENGPKLRQLPMSEGITIRGPHFDDTRPHLLNFFDAVRTRKPVVEDALFGHHAALACHMANESYFRKSAVSWDAGARAIRS
jgi:predicted dehydrogenase